jgi:1-acyl-sn-glycerol-3-phosphate acyltransferase
VAAEVRARIFTVRQLVDAVHAAGGPFSGDGADAGWATLLSEPPDPEIVDTLTRRQRLMPVLLWLTSRVGRLLIGLRPGIRVRGLDRLPAEGICIICPNHQSHLDPFVLGSVLPFHVLRRMFFVGAAEYYQTRLARRFARALRVIPIDADANLVSAMRAGAAGLALGRVLILFPEGERSIDGEIKPFRKGAAILSAHTGAPIVPLAIDGAFPLWPRGRRFQWRALFPGRSRPIGVSVGQPLAAEPGRYAEATAALQAAVAAELTAIRAGR